MPQIEIPPGVRFLAQIIPKLCTLPLVIVLAQRLLLPSLPTWLTVLSCVSAYPLVLTIVVQYDIWRKLRKAKNLGAELPPMPDHKLPGGMDLLSEMKEAHDNRFPGR